MSSRFFSANTLFVLVVSLSATVTFAQEALLLDTTTIRTTKELPKVMYMVPWQQQENNRKVPQMRLKLHSLCCEVFEPVYPENSVHP